MISRENELYCFVTVKLPGNLICKRMKNNPYVIQDILVGDLNDGFTLMNGEEDVIKVKDIALMSRESTFQAPLKKEKGTYRLHQISMIDKREMPKVNEETHETVENLDLGLEFDL